MRELLWSKVSHVQLSLSPTFMNGNTYGSGSIPALPCWGHIWQKTSFFTTKGELSSFGSDLCMFFQSINILQLNNYVYTEHIQFLAHVVHPSLTPAPECGRVKEGSVLYRNEDSEGEREKETFRRETAF